MTYQERFRLEVRDLDKTVVDEFRRDRLVVASVGIAVPGDVSGYDRGEAVDALAELHDQSPVNVTELGGCFGCLATVAKELPCIYYAVKGGGFDSLTKCGVGKPDVSDRLHRTLIPWRDSQSSRRVPSRSTRRGLAARWCWGTLR
jgi:hypothetical protein